MLRALISLKIQKKYLYKKYQYSLQRNLFWVEVAVLDILTQNYSNSVAFCSTCELYLDIFSYSLRKSHLLSTEGVDLSVQSFKKRAHRNSCEFSNTKQTLFIQDWKFAQSAQ